MFLLSFCMSTTAINSVPAVSGGLEWTPARGQKVYSSPPVLANVIFISPFSLQFLVHPHPFSQNCLFINENFQQPTLMFQFALL